MKEPSRKPRARAAGGRRASALAEAPDRRAEILRIAAQLFAEHGYEFTTTRQIATAAKILAGSLYHYFPTKEDMLSEIVSARSAFLLRGSEHIANGPQDAEVRLTALIVFHLLEFTSHRHVYATLYNERRLFDRASKFAYLSHNRRIVYAIWHSLLLDGRRAGLFRDADPFLDATTIIRMLSTTAEWYNSIGAVDLPAVLRHQVAFILQALREPARIQEWLPPLDEAQAIVAEILRDDLSA